MTRLSFWHKVVFIANMCWLFSWIMKYYTILPDGALRSGIIITGLLIANVANVVLHVWIAVLFLSGGSVKNIPLWLRLTNFIFLFFQLILLLK